MILAELQILSSNLCANIEFSCLLFLNFQFMFLYYNDRTKNINLLHYCASLIFCHVEYCQRAWGRAINKYAIDASRWFFCIPSHWRRHSQSNSINEKLFYNCDHKTQSLATSGVYVATLKILMCHNNKKLSSDDGFLKQTKIKTSVYYGV